MFKNSARLIPPCVCARALEFNALVEIDRDGGSSVPRSWFLRTATLCRPSPLRGSNVQDVWSLNQARRQLTIKSHFSFLFLFFFQYGSHTTGPDKKEEGTGQQQHITDRVYLWKLAAPGRINKKRKMAFKVNRSRLLNLVCHRLHLAKNRNDHEKDKRIRKVNLIW